MSDQDDKRTDPELPHVNPLSAPPIELPRPPPLPTDIEERRERPTPALPEGFLSMPEERESLVTAFRNMLEAHEQREVEDRGMLRSEVANLTRRFDQWADNAQALFGDHLRGRLLEDFKEAMREIADRFLEPIGSLTKHVADLQEGHQTHELRWKRLDKLRLDELREQYDSLVAKIEELQKEVAAVRDQLALLSKADPVP